MRSMKRTMVRSIAPLAIIFSTALAARAVETPKAPGETVREEFAKIQAAQNLDDVLHLVPDEHREMVSEMTPEEKEAALLQWKGGVASMEVVRDRVEGDRGAVLVRNRNDNRSLTVFEMRLEAGEWRKESDVLLFNVSPGAEGSFETSGPAPEKLRAGVIGQNWINGVPILTISDPLDFSDWDLTVQLPIPECPEQPGSHELKPVSAGNVTVGGSLFGTNGTGESVKYSADFGGALEITEVAGDLFSGSFTFGVAAEEGEEQIQVRGLIRNAFLPCRMN